MTVLGISVGTSTTGVCVLRGDELLERQMHTYHVPWSDTKLRIIINQYRHYIVKRNVKAIMVKIPPLNKHTKAITVLLKRIEQLAEEHDCAFDLITKSEIKHVLTIRSTAEIIEYAKLLYPVLSVLYNKGSHNGHRKFKKVYEAVLGAHIYKERQRVRAYQRKTE